MEENKTNDIVHLFFIGIIGLTILTPQILASWFSPETVSEYLTDITKVAVSILGSIVVFIFSGRFSFKIPSRLLLALLSFMPILSLIIAVGLFLYHPQRKFDSQVLFKEKAKDMIFLILGYLSMYNFMYAITGLVFLTGSGEEIYDFIRLAVSTLFLYVIYQRKINLGENGLLLYTIIAFVLTFLLSI